MAADGNPIHQQVVRFGQSVPVTLDVTGVLRLRLEIADPPDETQGYGGFAVPRAKRLD